MKKIISVITLAVLFAACGGGGASDKQSELDKMLKEQAVLNQKIRDLKEAIRNETGDKSGIRLVEINPPVIESFRHYVEVQARVEGDRSVSVSSRTQGTVTSIFVTEGDKVSKGQLLASLDDQILQQSLAEVETQYLFAKNIFEKQKNLWDQKIGSEVQFLTAKNNYESLGKRRAAMMEQLDLTRIKSPVDGTVDNVHIKVGQALAPGMPAVAVVNLSGLKVKAEVGESYIGKIGKGDDAIIVFPDLNREITTKVSFASKIINTLNRTFHVEVPLTGDVSDFRPNMIAVMKIVDYKNDSAMVVPVDLLQRSADGQYLMVAVEKDGKLLASRKNVETGKTYSGRAEITGGLSMTDKIITTGYRDLNEGQELRTK